MAAALQNARIARNRNHVREVPNQGDKMRKISVALSIAFTLIAATAVSAFCANVVGEVPSSSGGPLSDVQLSQANHPIQMLAQAGPTDTNPLVSDGLLKPVTGSADPDAAGATSDDKPKPKPTPTPKPTRTPVPGCKNGRAVGNKHCIPSPSE
jgi:hypothetical protein